MGSQNYRFNTKTLSYERNNSSWLSFLKKSLRYVLVSTIAGGLIAAVIIYNYDTPGMKSLKHENSVLLTQYNQMNAQLSQIESALEDMKNRENDIFRVTFNSEPIPSNIRLAGTGGAEKYANLDLFKNEDIIINTAKKIDAISKQTLIQSKAYEDVFKLALEKENQLASVPAIMPVSTKDFSHISSGWGFRDHPVYKVPMFHYGIDFVAPYGSKIYATGDGIVKSTKSLRDGFGRSVVIDHGYGYETLYGHMKSYIVKKGQKIKRGDVIGYLGSTGTSTAPHLHYSVHKDGAKVNPRYYFFKDLSAEDYEKMVIASSSINRSF